MADHHNLHVWEQAHVLTLAIYGVTNNFPRAEIYGLTSQIRRACASIPANLAEGSGRGGDIEFARFCRIALGSASELEYHLLLARDLAYLSSEDYNRLATALSEVSRMLNGLCKKLKNAHNKSDTTS